MKHLPKGYEPVMLYGMITYVVPLKLYSKGYHCQKGTPLPYASLAAQKNYYSLYFMGIYANSEAETWLREAIAPYAKKVKLGKSCLRFKHLEDIPLNLVGKAIAKFSVKKYIAMYESVIG